MLANHNSNLIAVLMVLVSFSQIYAFKPTPCPAQNNKLLSLLNLLCNTTQTTSIQARDACYGCFFRAGNIPSGATQLSSLSQCATAYLNGTAYAECATNLAALASGATPTGESTSAGCYSEHCAFVRCVRGVNANNLIDGCITENLTNRNLTIRGDRIGLYTNVTSCILARARCNSYNPISGELQNQATGIYGHVLNTAAYYNSLHISPAGDIRIIAFPMTIGTSELFCSRFNGLEQSTQGVTSC